MKILFIGDIVGFVGRAAVLALLPKLVKKYKVDGVIANIENIAHGKGVTENTLKELEDVPIAAFTSGNHIFAKKGVETLLGDEKRPVLRPANFPPGVPGAGEKVINIGGKSVLLLNLMGRVFMKDSLDCPFRTFDAILQRYSGMDLAAVLVDFHAEATSEKNAFKYYADGRATAIIGTHTHIPTADESITEHGTAYLTDAGAVMAHNSVLGVGTAEVLKAFLTQMPYPHTLPRIGMAEFNAVLITVDPKRRRATGIKRIREFTDIR